ncbi:thioredoxin family protein [Anaeromonas frigoriresistens]|uniref:thioredoxin family protein n=1 Tax=Anaeromonas frigoriresistens TaxID=2683708 RepID=UPI003315A167
MVDEALEKLNYDFDFDIISDIQLIAKSGINKPPAITINDKVVVEGYIPTVEELVEKLKEI